MPSNDRKSTLSLKHSISVLSHEKHAHSLKGILRKTNEKRSNVYMQKHTRMHVGMYDCMRRESESQLGNQLSGILRETNRKRTNTYMLTHTRMHAGMHDCMRSESESELGTQLSGILNKTNKQTNMHNCVSVYVYVYEERERISVTLVTTAAQACESDLCMCARARVCSYYFANLSTVSLHLPVHTVEQKHSGTHTCQVRIEYRSRNDRKSTLSLKHSISVLSHEKHAHSLKR